MPIVPVPGLLKMQVLSTQESTQRVWTGYYQRSIVTPPSITDLNNYCIQWAALCLAAYTSIHTSTWNDDKVVCTDYGVVGGAQGQQVISQPHPGSQSSDASPANVALVCSLLSGFTSRSKRGRVYHGGFIDADAIGSLSLAGAIGRVTTFQALAASFGSGFTPQLAYSVYSPTLGIATPVLAQTVGNVLDSQRRRLPGRGR